MAGAYDDIALDRHFKALGGAIKKFRELTGANFDQASEIVAGI
jgi:hypothetical protein